MRHIIVALFLCTLVGCASTHTTNARSHQEQKGQHMKLGNFSVSLAVKDIRASHAFYEKLGFRIIGGDINNRWLIMQNDDTTIGLFQGMFTGNILTFNPGWDKNCATLPEFQDVRDIQRSLKAHGLALTTQADESTTGPASLTLQDPDGNQILIDQHAPSPTK